MSKQSPIFCVCGRKGSGKDSLLEVIAPTAPDTTSKLLAAAPTSSRIPAGPGEAKPLSKNLVVKLAGTLKDGVASFYGWDRKMLDGTSSGDRVWREIEDVFWTKALKRSVTPRSELQRVGTEGMRGIGGENFWVYSMLKTLEHTGSTTLFVGDCRFLNELTILSGYFDVYILYVERELDSSLPYFHYMQDILRGRTKNVDDRLRDEIIQYMLLAHPGVHRSEWESLLISLLWRSENNFIHVKNSSTLEEYINVGLAVKDVVNAIVEKSS